MRRKCGMRNTECGIGRFAALVSAAVMLAVSAVPASGRMDQLTLDQCVEMAMRSNLSIETAKEKLAEKDAAIKEASSANMPTLSAQAAYTRVIPQPENPMASLFENLAPIFTSMGAPVPAIAEISPNVYTLGLTATQVLYAGGKISNAKKIRKHDRAAAEWQRQSAVREIRRDVTKAYYQALAVNRNIVAIDSSIALVEVTIRDLSNLVEVGMLGEHELLQVQVQLANLRLTRQQVATGAQAAHDYLAMLIGVPVNTTITLVEEMDAPGSLNMPEVPDLQRKARDISTDMKALEEQMKIVEASLHITGHSITKPTILAQAGYSGQGIGQGKDGSWDNSGNVSLIAQWDIYDFGAANSKRRQTLSQKRQLELGMEQLGIGLDMQVKNSIASLQDAFTSLETHHKSIEQTKRSYQLSYDKFQEGMLPSLELMTAQNLRLQAEIAYYAALSQFYMSQADLDYLVNEER